MTETTDFSQFIQWETSAEVIDFKRAYVDMTAEPGKPTTGDTLAGLLLSQIVYYHLPNRRARKEHQLDVERDGWWWLVRKRTDWWDECRILPNRFDRLIKVLQDRGLVVVHLWKHGGVPTHHIRLDYPTFMEKWMGLVRGLPTTTIHNPQPPVNTKPILADHESPILADGENGMILADGENGILADHESPRTLADHENDLILDKIKKTLILLSGDFSKVWAATLGELKLQMTKATFNTWLKDTKVLGVYHTPPGDTPPHCYLVVGVRNDYAKDWLSNRLAETILRTASDIMIGDVLEEGVELRWHCVVMVDEPIPTPKPMKVHHNGNGRSPKPQTPKPGLTHDPRYREMDY